MPNRAFARGFTNRPDTGEHENRAGAELAEKLREATNDHGILADLCIVDLESWEPPDPTSLLPTKELLDVVRREDEDGYNSPKGEAAKTALRNRGLLGWKHDGRILLSFPKGSDNPRRRTIKIIAEEPRRKRRGYKWNYKKPLEKSNQRPKS